MALTNIFREPRREITETAVGLALAAPFFAWDWCASSWVVEGAPPPSGPPFLLLLLLFIPIATAIVLALLALVAIAIHAAGEGLCNALEDRGIHLRPRRRPEGARQ